MTANRLLIFFCALALSQVLVYPLGFAEENNQSSTAGGSSTKIIPLPVYATLPNEGDTFGLMPVFMTVEDKDQRTASIIAPSLTWNKIIRWTHTFRLYLYPTSIDTINIIPTFSSHVNRGFTLEYKRQRRHPGAYTLDSGFHMQRSLFYRFFGLGPESKGGNESSYTHVSGDLSVRPGYNLTEHFNIGPFLKLERVLAERINVNFLPLTHSAFPGTPGLGGATTLSEGLSFRADSREEFEYSKDGLAAEVLAGHAQSLAGSNGFGFVSIEGKALWEETSWLQGAARAQWSYVGGRDVPFYNQSMLGGSFEMRGFTENRFIDKGAWEIEIEQRISYLTTHIYGVAADWRVDPFVAIGQVYEDADEIIRHTRIAGGLGFRAFVRPNVLGRVDTAIGGDGLKVYVELGYPF